MNRSAGNAPTTARLPDRNRAPTDLTKNEGTTWVSVVPSSYFFSVAGLGGTLGVQASAILLAA